MPNVPLPGADLIGSVERKVDPSTTYSYELYYDAAPGTLKAYLEALGSAGWKTSDSPMVRSGGFVSSTSPEFAIYCKPNAVSIMTQTGPDPRDLLISITPAGDTASEMCGGAAAIALMVAASMPSLLPDLQAPPGVTMSVTSPGSSMNVRSAAYIQKGSSAAKLLEGFATQMTGTGWQASARAGGPGIASQAFQKLDDKKTLWQCVISVHAIDDKPGDYVAFVDMTSLDGASTGNSSGFIRSP